MEIKFYNCKLHGLAEDKTKESAHFRFYRRQLLYSTTERAAWGDRKATLKAALIALNKKSPSGNVTLKKKDAEAIHRALENYKAVDGSFTGARLHSRELLAIIDEAGMLYKKDKKSAAAMKLGWTSGKKTSEHELNEDIFMQYLFETTICEPSAQNRQEVIEKLQKIMLERTGTNVSREAIIKNLKRTRARLKNNNPDFHVIIPG